MDRTAALASLAQLILLAACSGPGHIQVGSKNFTEQVILGELVAQRLERSGLAVQRRLNLGGTLLAHQALAGGQIDVYPEYTGTAALVILKQPVSADPAAVYRTVRSAYAEKFQLQLLPPLGFDNTFAMVVRATETVNTLSEAAQAKPWRLGAGYEFASREDGLAALNRVYALRWAGTPATMDLGLLYRALRARQVDMIAANATDGELARGDLKHLADDRGAFPPYQACLLVRKRILEEPAVRSALLSLSGKINDAEMRRLNYEVDVEKRPVPEVVAAFLQRLDKLKRE